MLENLRGKVCRCSNGRLGLVADRKYSSDGEVWVGIDLDKPRKVWQSKCPVVVYETAAQYVARIVQRCPVLLNS
jgi:hypothetical protein